MPLFLLWEHSHRACPANEKVPGLYGCRPILWGVAVYAHTSVSRFNVGVDDTESYKVASALLAHVSHQDICLSKQMKEA